MAELGAYQAPDIVDPSSVALENRRAWCFSQIAACSTLCGGNSRANSCAANELSCICVCSNGFVPDLALYARTLPSSVNVELANACVSGSVGDVASQRVCADIRPSGRLEPSRVATSTQASSTSSTRASTSTPSLQSSSSSRSPPTSSSSSQSLSSSSTSGSIATGTQGSASGETGTESTNTSPQSSAGLSTGAKAGLGVGIAVGVLALIVVLFLLWRRRKNKSVAPEGGYTGKSELHADSTVAAKNGVAPGPAHEVGNEEMKRGELDFRDFGSRHELGEADTRFRSELEGSHVPDRSVR